MSTNSDLPCVRFYGEPCDPENCCGGRNSKGEPTLRARPLYQRAARVAELEAEVEQLRAALEGAISVAQWMSGSESFSPGGEAHDGWLRQREVLFAAMKVLEAVRG